VNVQERAPAPPAAVIFDIGRVIIGVNLMRALAPLGASRQGAAPLAPAQVWAAIQTDPRWRDWQEGRMNPREWHEHLTCSLELSLGFEEFCAAWNRALEPRPILSDDLFARLEGRCRLALLSNTDPLHIEHLERHFSFCRYFPVRIYSCKFGTTKPRPAIYRAALDAVGVKAAEALYIDDVKEFAEAARQLGLDAIRFESAGQLASELARRGLLDA
jgi:glucose-1-phosphatase